MRQNIFFPLQIGVGQAMLWLVFLANPLISLFQNDHTITEQSTGIAATVIFAAAYVTSFLFGPDEFSWQIPVLGATMTVCAVVMFLIIGPPAVAYHPYLVSYGVFVLPSPYRLLLGLTVSAISMTMSFTLGTFWVWPTCLAILLVGSFITTALERMQLAIKIENENLVTSERNRMAMDVHDLVGHSLTVVKLKTQLASKLITSNPDRAKTELTEVQEIIATALGGIRQTVIESRVLSPSAELASAVETLQATGLDTRVLGDSDEPTGPIRMALGWVVREATTNILRHAQASTCEFSFGKSSISISDDGNGPPHKEGNGIRGMRERVAAAGGSFSVGSSQLGGTRIEVSW